MPNYATLATTIAGASYAGQTDQQIVAALNASAAGPSQAVSIAAILLYLRGNNLWLPIKNAATSSTPNLGAVAALDIFQDGHTPSLDLTGAAAQAMLGALVQGGLLTTAQSEALTAMCQTVTTPAAQMGFGNGVALADLPVARALP